MPGIAFHHRRDHCSQDTHQPGQVYIDHLSRVVHFPFRSTERPVDTGKVDKTIYMPHRTYRRTNAVFILNIQDLIRRPAWELIHQRHQLIFRSGRDNDLCAAPAYLVRQGFTQPVARADQPIPFPAPLRHSGSFCRIVATSSATLKPNLRNWLRLIIVPSAVR